MMKYALCGVALVALMTPALAAGKFYVVRDTATKECSIAEQKPTVATMKVVGTSYSSQAKAEKAMKVAKICDTK